MKLLLGQFHLTHRNPLQRQCEPRHTAAF